MRALGWAAAAFVVFVAGACAGRAATDQAPSDAGAGAAGPGGAGGQVDGAPGGSDGSGGSAGADGGCGTCLPLEACGKGNLCVARSVSIPGGYAIDATEVTRSQYAAWLGTSPSTGGQPAPCAWNPSFAPDAACMAKPSVCAGAGCRSHPQVCVDQCDAAAYCKAVGKRLCGTIQGVTGSNPKDPAKSQWHNACTSGGVDEFAYGNKPEKGKCNDYMTLGTTTVPVGSSTGCQSPVAAYSGVFDLIGNAAEWEDNSSTSAGAADIFEPRGLSFGMGAAMPTCASSDFAQRAEPADNRGFRCCVP